MKQHFTVQKWQQILAGILVIQVILSVIVFWPRSAATGGSAPVFPDLTAEDIVSLTVTGETGEQATLRKTGDEWEFVIDVASATGEGYPAKAETITPILEKLVGLNTLSPVTNTPDSHKRLQVADDDFVRRIDFKTANGEEHTVYLGSAPRYTATHFRVGGENETYLTTELSSWELNTSAASWIDTSYFNVDATTLAEIVLHNANGTFTLVKDATDQWVLDDLAEDETMSTSKVSTLVRNATSVILLAPLGKEEQASYGMEQPNATITLKTTEGTLYLLQVGAQYSEDTSYIVKASESAYYVRVAQYNVSALVENTRDDFLELEPTPTPAP
ncbi:MAG: DUF4340 domain-containing protein [Anaerolineae bacterium]|nr:DUF4340 domain-containing protein [Anaerolineae bacterium]